VKATRVDMKETPRATRDAAVAWLVRLTSGTCDGAGRRAHTAWLAESWERRQAFQEVERVWGCLGSASTQLLVERSGSSQVPGEDPDEQQRAGC
jgi:transmembrane sensor